MKAIKLFSDAIRLYLGISLFFEGIFKIAFWVRYSHWLQHAPLIHSIWMPLLYIIPLVEIGLSIGLLFSNYKILSMYLIICTSILFIIWITSWMLFTKRIYSPFFAIWPKAYWKEKLMTSLINSWFAFSVILILKGKCFAEIKKLRNPSAGQQIAGYLDP